MKKSGYGKGNHKNLNRNLILKGNICHTPEKDNLVIRENAYVVCEEGTCRGIFDEIPEAYSGMEVIDCTGMMILPGMVDLHTHAPQFIYRGTGMDYELLEWLDWNGWTGIHFRRKAGTRTRNTRPGLTGLSPEN